MNEIKIFSNPQFGEVRMAMSENNEPLFCLVDVAKALGYKNPAKAVIDHCKGVTVLETPTNGGIQSIKFGREGDMYRLVLKSNAPKAEEFQAWVCDDVLPTIRKHGVYATPQTIDNLLADPDNAIKVFQTLKEERQLRQLAEAKIEADAPKVLFHDAVTGSKSTCLVGELAKIITQNDYKIGQNRLFEWLRENGYLGKRGEYYNIPNQQYMEMGLFDVKKTVHDENGVMVTKTTTKVTGKGQAYFINKFLNG